MIVTTNILEIRSEEETNLSRLQDELASKCRTAEDENTGMCMEKAAYVYEEQEKGNYCGYLSGSISKQEDNIQWYRQAAFSKTYHHISRKTASGGVPDGLGPI